VDIFGLRVCYAMVDIRVCGMDLKSAAVCVVFEERVGGGGLFRGGM
jgi:hypothetical protein